MSGPEKSRSTGSRIDCQTKTERRFKSSWVWRGGRRNRENRFAGWKARQTKNRSREEEEEGPLEDGSTRLNGRPTSDRIAENTNKPDEIAERRGRKYDPILSIWRERRPTPTYEKGEPTRKWKAYQRPDCRKYDQTRPETRSPKGEDEKTTLFRRLTKKENPTVKWKAYQRPDCRKHEDEKDEQTRPDRRKSRTKIRPYIVNLTREEGLQVARLPKIWPDQTRDQITKWRGRKDDPISLADEKEEPTR